MLESRLELNLPDSLATDRLGAALARAWSDSGQGSAVVFLQGELGAGKTTCVRSLLRALGVEGLIRSPTYTLVEAYPLPTILCVHVDLYRLQGALAVDELGLRDYFDSDCLLLVEWPEKGGDAVPPSDLGLALDYLENARRCRVTARTARGRRWLERLTMDSTA
jgi:tRNA threonylcarbamoyladenosine biosynthesis protein TsaE